MVQNSYLAFINERKYTAAIKLLKKTDFIALHYDNAFQSIQ